MKTTFTAKEMQQALKQRELETRIEIEVKIMHLIEQLNKDEKITTPTLLVKTLYQVLKKSTGILTNQYNNQLKAKREGRLQ